MDEFQLINKYFLPISSLEGQQLKNDAAVITPKKNLQYVVSTTSL